MQITEERLVPFLEKRIEFYRRCMAWTFILGLLTGVSVFCGERTVFVSRSSGISPVIIKNLFCFAITVTGITAGFAFRRRIGFLKSCREKVLLEFSDGRFFPKPARAGIITEMQVLFGIMFTLCILAACTQYPVPKLPVFLDSDPLRMLAIAGFIGMCSISVCPERRNPLIRINSLQGFLEEQKIRVPARQKRPEIYPTYAADNPDLQKSEVPPLYAKRSVQL